MLFLGVWGQEVGDLQQVTDFHTKNNLDKSIKDNRTAAQFTAV